MTETSTRCGFVALIGRPNVGKSTLLNHLVGQKVSIVSRKPQTTRHRILGIKTKPTAQIIYVDTPGMHTLQTSILNQAMNEAAVSTLHDADVVVWIMEAGKWTDLEDKILEKLIKTQTNNLILALNKIDKLEQKESLLPWIQTLQHKCAARPFQAIVPLSALKNQGLNNLESEIINLLPHDPFFYESDAITDKTLGFRIAEIIREKCMNYVGDELPYSLNIEIENIEQNNGLCKINAIIWVERSGQKIIVIGQKGDLLKQIGTQARLALEKLLNQKVFLKLWVKVKKNWSDDRNLLKQWGYWEFET